MGKLKKNEESKNMINTENLRINPIWLSLTVLFLFTGCTSLSTGNPQAIRSYNEARQYQKKGTDYWYQAVKSYRKSLMHDTRFIEAYLALGRLYEEKGKVRKAAQQFQAALYIDPNRADLYLDCGRAMFNAEQYKDALTYLQQYHAFFPKKPEGLYWMAETERALNNPVAEDYFLQLVRMDSTDESYTQSLANFYFYKRDYQKAAPVYARLMKRTKQPSGQMYYEYGYTLIRLQRWNEAKEILEKAANISGNKSVAHDYWQIVTKISLGYFSSEVFLDYLDAVLLLEDVSRDETKKTSYQLVYEYLRNAVSKEPDFTLAHRELAGVCYVLGKDDEAIASFEHVIRSGRATADEYTDAAYLYFRKGKYDKALSYYEQSVRMKPGQSHVDNYIQTVRKIISGETDKDAYFFYDRGISAMSFDSAEFYLNKALEEDSAYAEAFLQLGVKQLQTGRFREAEKSFIGGLKVNRDTSLASVFRYNLGLAYAKRDFHDRAIAQFDTALMLQPGDDETLYQMAKVYVDKSDLAGAIQRYDRLIRGNPNYFRPSENDMKAVGIDPTDFEETNTRIDFGTRLKMGQKNRYQLKVLSKADALLGADMNGDLSREITVVFTEQVVDTTSYGVTELAIEIESVQGYALTAMEKKAAGKTYYLRVSDVFGVTHIYGLIEENPYSLQRLVINIMEDLHSGYLRKPVAEGELWQTNQYVFKMGHVDAVAVLDESDANEASGKKYFGVFGSYDAAKYGEVGKVYIQLEGNASFVFDTRQGLMRQYKNSFVTKTFKETSASLEVQTGSYDLQLLEITHEKLGPPDRVVISGVPYVKQHGPQCAAASLSMIMAFYRDTIDQDSIYSAIKSDYAGAQSHDIIRYPRSLGRYKAFGYIGTLEDLKKQIDHGMPVIVFLTPYGYGHVVVVIGYDENRHQIIMHDPTVADHHAVGYDDFLQEWRQSGNECALVVPFGKEINVTEGPIAHHQAVETKWLGDKSMGKNQHDQAVTKYREALAALPDYEGALEGVLMVYLAKDQFDQASAVLDTLLNMNPGSVDLILRNAGMLLSQYAYDKVLQLTQKIKQLDESNIVNYLYAASALFSQKKYDEAIVEVKKAINLNPLVSTPRNMLSGYLAEKGDFGLAYEQAEFSIKYEPENVGNYMNLSGIYQSEIRNRFLTGPLKARKMDKALEAMDMVKKTNPSLPNLDQIYADLYVEADREELADSLFFENINKYPEENGAYNNLAWRWATRGIKLKEAEVHSNKSIELSRRNPYYFDTMAWIHFKMAIQYQKTGKKDSADMYFRKAESGLKETIDYDMYSDFAYRHLGVVYEKWGKTDLAKSQYDIVIGLLPDKARTCVEIAKDCEEAGLYDTAVDFYQKALNADPALEYAAFRLAYLYVKTKKNLNDAMIFAETALEKDSVNFNYIGVKGIVYYAKNDFPNAKILLEKAVRLQRGYCDREARAHYYYLGLVFKAMNQKQKSAEWFMEYLKKDPYGDYAEDAKKLLKG